ncbi:MAG: hypothetical protein ACU85E_14355 [Gammaproteobacteria bacterium]
MTDPSHNPDSGQFDSREAKRQALRCSLRRPSLWNLPLIGLILVVGIPLMAWLTNAIESETGIASGILILALVVAGRKLAQKRGDLSIDEIESEIHAHDAALTHPWLARMLGIIEVLIFTILALVKGPAIGRWMLGSDVGELGFGGLIFLFGGWFLALIAAFMTHWFTTRYLQDRYMSRLLFDMFALTVLVRTMTWL